MKWKFGSKVRNAPGIPVTYLLFGDVIAKSISRWDIY